MVVGVGLSDGFGKGGFAAVDEDVDVLIENFDVAGKFVRACIFFARLLVLVVAGKFSGLRQRGSGALFGLGISAIEGVGGGAATSRRANHGRCRDGSDEQRRQYS